MGDAKYIVGINFSMSTGSMDESERGENY